MRRLPLKTRIALLAGTATLGLAAWPLAAQAQTPDDEAIRRAVAPLLAAKDAQIEELAARVRQLEQRLAAQQPVIDDLAAAPRERPAPAPAAPAPDRALETKVATLGEELAELRDAQSEGGLETTGFFSVDARTENQDTHTFDLGLFEMDLNYTPTEHFAGSVALLWDDGEADIGVAVLDYHLFDDGIPARGRIFQAEGMHLQAGRFDLPFLIDYQYYSSPDRVSVSAPLTTDRIQGGGFNSDGVRIYGSGGLLNYAAYWTNSVYEDDGFTGGGRVGVMFGRNPFRLHSQAPASVLEIGVSALADMDRQQDRRRAVYAADLAFNYGLLRLEGEWATIRQEVTQVDIAGLDYGKANEQAWQVTLVTDLQGLVDMPLKSYVRYDTWDPGSPVVLDDDGLAYAADIIDRLTLGLNYTWNDYLQLKFEYTDSLGTHTDEPDFEHRLGTASLVASF